MLAIDFGLNGLPRSLRWPWAASFDGDGPRGERGGRSGAPGLGEGHSRRGASPGGLLQAAALAGLLLLAVARRLELGHQGRLLELGDAAQHPADQHRGRGVLEEVLRAQDAAIRVMPRAFREVVAEQLLNEVAGEAIGTLDDDGARAVAQEPLEHLRERRPPGSTGRSAPETAASIERRRRSRSRRAWRRRD